MNLLDTTFIGFYNLLKIITTIFDYQIETNKTRFYNNTVTIVVNNTSKYTSKYK